jgi:hypothetical protein
MSRPIIISAGAATLLLALVAWRINGSSPSSEIAFAPKSQPPSAAPLCPWREPENDLKQFFPGATRCERETRILSDRRVELAEQLGRVPTGDENALLVYCVYHDQTPLGVVMTRRVKGANGAIELVLAVNADGAVRGLRLQRLREPAPIAAALQNPDWLHSFEGRRAADSWKLGRDVPEVAADARLSAEAIVEGVRSLLILLATNGQTHNPIVTHHH